MAVKVTIVLLTCFYFGTGTMGCLRVLSDPLNDQCKGEHCSAPRTTAPSTSPSTNTALWECGFCGEPIDITLRVRNSIVEPTFEDVLEMHRVNRRELLHHLLEAANTKSSFRFSMTHHGHLGLMVDAINGLRNNWTTPMTYWRLLHADGTPLEEGISKFIPEDEEEIVFSYTLYSPGSPE